MNKKFFRYAIITAFLTYSSVYISLNYNTKIAHNLGKQSVSAAESEGLKPSNYEVESEGAFFTPVLNNNGDRMLYSSGDDIYEYDLGKKDIKQITTMGNCYNPAYWEKNNDIIVFARNDGIFKMNIKSKIINKIAGSQNPQISFAKPNITPDGAIVYYKVLVIAREGGHGFSEKDPAIYMLSADGKKEEKIINGYNPLLSNDGKSLIYEWKDSIYIMDLESKKSRVVDSGKYASLSSDGKTISYAKYERETVPYNKIQGKSKLFVDKEFSNIYIADLNNPQNKRRITSQEFDNKDVEVESWARDIKDTGTEQHFLLVSKISYFDTAWSKNGDALYVSTYNTDIGDFELIKVNPSKK